MGESFKVMKKATVEVFEEVGSIIGQAYDTRVVFVSDNTDSVQYALSGYVPEEGKVLIDTILTLDYDDDGYDQWTLKAFYGELVSDDE